MRKRVLCSCLVVLGVASVAMGQESQNPRTLEAIRKYALSYAQSLPDYTCVQVTNREYVESPLKFQTKLRDEIEEELSFVDGEEHYKVAKVNGFPATNRSHEELGGAVSEGEFGSLLKHLFDPQTGATFRAAPGEKIQGRSMNVFTFTVTQSKGYAVYDEILKGWLTLGYQGAVYADAGTNAVMRLTMKCVDFPPETRYARLELTLDYKATELSGQKFILPSHVKLDWSRRSKGRTPGEVEEGTNTVDFKMYQKFKAESKIDFGADGR